MPTARLLDQFYTKPAVAEACLAFLQAYLAQHPLGTPFFIEPSAGAGAFLRRLPPDRSLGLDIAPKCHAVTADFFDFTPGPLVTYPLVVVGNPPFGRNSSLALRFINKAAEFAQVIAFILPRTFRKPSLAQKVHPQFHLAAELPLLENAFVFQGTDHAVPSVFQIWVRKTAARLDQQGPLTHADFLFTTPEHAVFAIRRVGRQAGKLVEDFAGYALRTHYYIQPLIEPEQCKAAFRSADWNQVKHDTAGIPSVSKRELIALYSQARSVLAQLSEACA